MDRYRTTFRKLDLEKEECEFPTYPSQVEKWAELTDAIILFER